MSDYMPGAVQVPQPGGVTLDTSLPPRFVWHITWDALHPDGTQPEFSAVAGYLHTEEWCPHIMWNPFTGYMEQYYPASVGSRALEYNDGDGAACVQVEIFFTPGCVVDGIKYATVADTPLKGWAELLAWGDSLGVPRAWPMGAPQWQDNPRDVGIWNGNAGHYGHCNSPGDTHTDPGPMPALTTPQEDTLSQAEVLQIQGFINDAADRIILDLRAHVDAVQSSLDKGIVISRAQAEDIVSAVESRLPSATVNFNYRPGANISGALDAIAAKPAMPGTVNVATPLDPQVIAAALVDHVNISITQK